MQRIQSAFDVHVRIPARQQLLSAFFGLACALHINLRWSLSRLSQNRDLVRQDLGKSPRHGKSLLSGTSTEVDPALREFSDQRRVSRQDAEITVLARNLRFLRSRVDHLLLRRDDLELKSICHGKKPASDLGPPTSALPRHRGLRSDVRGLTSEVCGPPYAVAFIFS